MAIEIPLARNTGLPSQGIHVFKITKIEEKASKTSGNEMIVISLTCQDPGDDQGKDMALFLSLSTKARFRIDELLDALNAPKKGNWTDRDMLGKLIRVDVIHSEFEGRTTAGAKTILPYSKNASIKIESPDIVNHGDTLDENLEDNVVDTVADNPQAQEIAANPPRKLGF